MRKKILLTLLILLIPLSLFAEDGPYSYEDLISLMNVNNLELHSQDVVIKNAILDVKDAKANYSPTIDLTISGTYMVNPPIDRITVSSDDLFGSYAQQMGIQNHYITLYDGMENTIYTASLGITQPIYTWGKISNAVKLYDKILEIRKVEKEDKVSSLSIELEGYLGGLYYAKEIDGYLDLASKDADRLLEIAKSGYENGVMLIGEYNEARLSKSELDMRRSEVEVEIYTLLENIRKSTAKSDLKLEDIDYVPNEEHYMSIATLNRDDLRVRAVSSANNSIKMANLSAEAAEYGRKVASGSMYGKPDIALQASLGYGGQRFPFIEKNWYREDDYTLNFTIGLKTTLWDGGKILNNVNRAKNQIESANITLESAKTELSIALEENFRNLDLALSRKAYYETKRDVLNDDLETLKKQNKIGYASESDIIEKSIEIYQNEIAILQEKGNMMQAALAIEYIAGLR